MVLIPLQSLGGEVALGCRLHLRQGAVDVLLLEVFLEPVVLVPANEEPHVLGSVQALRSNIWE
jgi:hypothetical protein